MANHPGAVTAPLLVQLQARAAARPKTATNKPFGLLVDEKHQAIDAELVARGLSPLDAGQVECLNDPGRADEAADMLDDLQARCGVSAAACEAVLNAETPTSAPVSAERVAELHRRKSQDQVDHIHRRDRVWDDALAGRS